MSKSLEDLQELADREVGDGSKSDSESDAESARSGNDEAPADDAEGGRSRARLGRSPVSAKGLLVSFLVAGAGLLAGASVPLFGGLVQYVGLFAAAFLLGAVRSRRRYVETAVAGGAASCLLFVASTLGGLNFFLGANFLAEYGLATAGAAVAGAGLTAGVVVSLLGYYFGRDLRDGLTRDV